MSYVFRLNAKLLVPADRRAPASECNPDNDYKGQNKCKDDEICCDDKHICINPLEDDDIYGQACGKQFVCVPQLPVVCSVFRFVVQ